MLRLILFLLGLMRRVWLYAWDLDILLSGDVFFLLCLWHHDVLLAAVCYCSAADAAAAAFGCMHGIWIFYSLGTFFFLLCLWHHDVLLAAVCYCSAATDAAAHYY